MWNYYEFDTFTKNAPINNASGIMIMYTNSDSSDYGGQYLFANGKVYGRVLNSGVFSTWTSIFNG